MQKRRQHPEDLQQRVHRKCLLPGSHHAGSHLASLHVAFLLSGYATAITLETPNFQKGRRRNLQKWLRLKLAGGGDDSGQS
jgi:hypothetical protein